MWTEYYRWLVRGIFYIQIESLTNQIVYVYVMTYNVNLNFIVILTSFLKIAQNSTVNFKNNFIVDSSILNPANI